MYVPHFKIWDCHYPLPTGSNFEFVMIEKNKPGSLSKISIKKIKLNATVQTV